MTIDANLVLGLQYGLAAGVLLGLCLGAVLTCVCLWAGAEKIEGQQVPGSQIE